MKADRNRYRVYEERQVFSTDEMVEMLHAEFGISKPESEAIISAWVNLLRYEVVRTADQDGRFSSSLQEGEAVFRLDSLLIPVGVERSAFGNQVARRTGVCFETVCFTFQKMSDILSSLKGSKAFEPIGWFEVVPGTEGGGFRVHLWEDFPQPASYKYDKISLSERLA